LLDYRVGAGEGRPHGLGHRPDVGDRHSAEKYRHLLPRKIGDATVEYFQLDDGGDTTRAVRRELCWKTTSMR
jgi:hypothetical protein